MGEPAAQSTGELIPPREDITSRMKKPKTAPYANPPRVVVVGSINMDLVARCQRLPQAGETVFAENLVQLPGGKGANQAVAAAQLGARCHLIGRVGDDAFGRQLTGRLAEYKVQTDAVMVTPQISSGVALIGVDNSGQNAITIVAGSNGQLSTADITHHQSLIESADAVVVQLEIPLETVTATVTIAKSHGIMTILDPAPVPAETLPQAIYEVDVMTPNETETQTLTGISVEGIESAMEAATVLRQRGVRLPVITLGRQGAVWIDESSGKGLHATSCDANVVDTTAAGDAFTAALAYRLAQGHVPAVAIPFACAAGAAATTALGAQNSMPTYDKVLEFVCH